MRDVTILVLLESFKLKTGRKFYVHTSSPLAKQSKTMSFPARVATIITH